MKQLKLMKTLLVAVGLCMGANAWADEVKYALSSGDTFTSGQTVNVKDDFGVVATITYGETGGDDFSAATADNSVNGYTAYTPGNNTNGNKTGGTFYTITPKYSGTIVVAIKLSADKAFYILENGEALEDYNGVTENSNFLGTKSFDVTANNSYKIYASGSKLGFYGFQLTYSPTTTQIYERGYTTAWSDADVSASAWVNDTSWGGTTSIDTRGLKVAHQRGGAKATNNSQISVTSNTLVMIDAVWDIGYCEGGEGENNSFTVGNNIEVRAYGYNQAGYVYINGEQYATITNACGKTNGNRKDDLWTIHLVINTALNKITAFTILGSSGTNKASYTLDGEISLAGNSTYNSLELRHNRTKGNNAEEACYLKNIRITERTQNIEKVNITFKYEDTNGNSLSAYRSDQILENISIGSEIDPLIISPYTDSFFNESSNKYVYANTYVVTGDYTTVQEGGNTITLKFTNYPATAYTFTGMCESTNLGTVSSGTAFLDGSATAYWSKYIYKEGNDTWYETTSPYGKTVTKASENVEYSTSEIDYFFECENTIFNSAGTTTGTSYSNGTTVTLAQNGAMETQTRIAAGTYNVSVYNTVRRSNEDQLMLQYSTDGTEWEDLGQTLTFPSNDAATQTATITLAAESYLRFKEPNVRNSCHNYDYITLTDVVKAAIADCKAHEASSDFATYIDGEKTAGRLLTANDVYAAHTAWQIAQAEAASSNDITKVIFDAAVSDFSRWNNARSNNGQQYTGAPDNKYFDAWDNQVSDARQTIYGLPAGTYTIKVATRSSETLDDVDKNYVWVYDGAATTKVLGNHIGNAGGCLGNGWNWTIIPFTVAEKANVSIGFYSLPGEGTGLWAGADDWHLYKGELTESVTVTDAGFATYASDCALDFSETAIKAYKVKVTKEGDADPVATLTKVNKVPAGTPVLLYKEGGDTNDVPVIANADAVSDNDLVRGTGAAVETTEDTYTNMILNNVGGNIGFYFANGKKVEKNRAYLHILTTNAPAAAGARMTIVFDEESTGIQKIESAAANKENGAYYNLAGQRVAQPTKGLYIVNGKKVVIK